MPAVTVIVTKDTQILCGRERDSQDPIIRADRGRNFSVAIIFKNMQAMRRVRDHLNELIKEEEAKNLEKELTSNGVAP